MIAEDISETANVLLEQVDSLDHDEKCDTIIRMSLYLMEWGGSMLAQNCGDDITARYQRLTREMEKLHTEIRVATGMSTNPGRSAGIIQFPKR